MAGMPYPPKNTTSIISGLRGYGRMPYPPNKRGAVETTAPPGDSGGIQTHDLQNFFSTKSFCSKNKKVQPRKAAPPGDSGGIQTHDLQNRNLTLYSAKLRNHCDFAVANLRKLFQTDERLLHKKRAEQTFS